MSSGSQNDQIASRGPALARFDEACSVLRQASEQLATTIRQNVPQDKSIEKVVDALSADASVLQNCLSDLKAAIAALQGMASGDDPTDEEATAWTPELEIGRLRSKLAEQIKYREQLNRSMQRNKRELELAKEEIAILRGSFSFRVGNLLIAAARSPRGLLLLPWRVMQLVRDAWPRVRQRIHGGLSARDLNETPDLGPDVSLSGDAAEWASLPPDHATPVRRMLLGTDTAPRLPANLAGMRIATIMDEFSFNAFRHCGDLCQIGAADWRIEVEAFAPHMLLVESAWKGKDDSWARKVYPLSRELVELIAWCRERRIPTVFWNKEDPVHLSVFMRTARQFDFVFTTDIDCVRAYKSALGHDQVYWMPFACQPEEHNPIEEYERRDAFCFAGSFYAKYPERQRDFATLVESMGSLRPVEIYDRNAGKDDPSLTYPGVYASMIQGTLPHDQISLAYKGYRYGININTVKQSQSMFARRAFELLACNTVTISNFSRGLRMLLGDLVISSDSANQLINGVSPLLDDEQAYRRFRLAGLRKVMSEHTYHDRLRYVLEKVGGTTIEDGLPRIAVIANAADMRQAEALAAAFERQRYPHKELVLVVPDGLKHEVAGFSAISASDAAEIQVRQRWSGRWLACFHPDDYYGAHYLTDLALATRYSHVDAIGKAAHYERGTDGVRLMDADRAYQTRQALPFRRAIARVQAADALDLRAFALCAPDMVLAEACSIDEFHYCANGVGMDGGAVDDQPGLWGGISLQRLHRLAETATAVDLMTAEQSASPVMDAESLGGLLPIGEHANASVSLTAKGSELRLDSKLSGDKHIYLYALRPVPVEQLFREEIGRFNFEVDTEMLVSFVLIFLDAERKRIGHVIRACSSNLSISTPVGARYVRLGLRIQGPGTARIKRLVLGHVPSPAAGVPARASYLIVSRGYPAYDNLYSYAYVHRRVLGYASSGMPVDVFRLTEDHITFSEFEGIDVVSGQLSDLELMLRSNPYKTVMVHSLDRAMWSVLKTCAPDREVLVWVHGAEIQPWYRRDFSFLDDRDRERGMQRSNDRMAFWRELFSDSSANVRFVFVSRHLLREAQRDVGIDLDPSRYVVIHNYIDNQLFPYLAKDVAQRKRLLSIRPYSRPTYANDLTVRAILDLSKEPFFGELEFRLIGDGRLFDETVEPLRGFPNVLLEKRFLSQSEIAALHRQYGVFLCPSRIDSQGVSRDEAMASGLVPITNRVSAIPEFVDEQCGFLAAPEDWRGMADAVRQLYADPDIFKRMSAAAARRVRQQSGKAQTLDREIVLIEQGTGAMPAIAANDKFGIPKRVALYGDLDMNLIDGSAVWAASLAEVLSQVVDVEVDFFLKTQIRHTEVIKGLLGKVNVRLIEPSSSVSRMTPDQALDAIAELDVKRGYQSVILRGFDLAARAVARPSLAGRLWIYLTDVPVRADALTQEGLQDLVAVAENAQLLLCQTPHLARHLENLAPPALGKTRHLPPMIPEVAARRSRVREPGQTLRVAYAGKFAPLWGIRQLFETIAMLRAEGLAIELHVFGDKIHNPPDDPAFREQVLDILESRDGVIWHRGLSRTEVLSQLGEMDVGWAWRHRELEENTLELSTKVLEYAACGAPPILARGAINSDLLGADYPLFADSASLADLLRTLASDAALAQSVRVACRTLAENYTFKVVCERHLAPLFATHGSPTLRSPGTLPDQRA